MGDLLGDGADLCRRPDSRAVRFLCQDSRPEEAKRRVSALGDDVVIIDRDRSFTWRQLAPSLR